MRRDDGIVNKTALEAVESLPSIGGKKMEWDRP